MKKLSLVILVASIFFSCQKTEKQNQYELSGILKNIPDSTLVSISADSRIINSAMVLDEKFQLSGTVNGPTHVYLIVENSKDYKSFWLENKKIDFDAEAGDFKNSIISGSDTQKEEDLLEKRVALSKKELDSLNTILFAMELDKRKSFLPLYNKITNDIHTEYKKFIQEFPNSLVSINLLNIYKTTWGKKESRALFLLMNDERQNSDDGNDIAQFIKINKNLQIGDTYIDFEQENVEGEKIRLSDIKAKYTLIEFWASWCGPCRASNPDLVKMYNTYKDKGFEIIGVSLDMNKKSWLKAIAEDKLGWENVSDLKGTENEAALVYGVNGIPDNILIDQNGKIIGRLLRDKELAEKLEELFD